MSQPATTPYRRDIDGLRALAVLLVILFHLDPELVPGGYIGVDVFFVISGYLITQRILARRTAGTWSLVGFYAGRVRRLIPAATATIAVTIGLSALVLDPGRMAQTGEASLYALVSLSNVHFWLSSGYFEPGAASRPLLHTWSLGVEEQFYLAWPLVMAALLPRDRWRIAVPILILGSTVWAEGVIGDGDAETAFFLPQFRFAELGIGCLLGLWAPTRLDAPPLLRARGEAVALGVALISLVGLGLVFDEDTRFPGLAAAGVAALSGLALITGRAPGVGRLLVHPVATFMGRVSYSAYLIHWPLIVLYRYVVHRPLVGAEVALGLPIIFGLAYLFHRGVETPFRHPPADGRNRFFIGQLAATILVAAVGIHAWRSGGWPGRVDELTKSYATARDRMGFRPCSSRAWKCPVGGRERPRFALIGDSHAKHLIFGLHELARTRGWSGLALTENGCAVLPGLVTLRRGGVRKICEASKGNIARAVADADPDLVVLSFGYLGYRGAFAGSDGKALALDTEEAFAAYWARALRGALERWARPGRHFALVLPSFRPGFDPVECLARPALIDRRSAGERCNLRARTKLEDRTRALRAALSGLAASRPDLILLDPNDALCEGERCRIEVDRTLLFSDDHHLTTKGSKLVADAFEAQLAPLLD